MNRQTRPETANTLSKLTNTEDILKYEWRQKKINAKSEASNQKGTAVIC